MGYREWCDLVEESHQRQLVVRSGPTYKNERAPVRLDMNHPPTPVGGISGLSSRCFCRRDLNYPPTAVGGIPKF